MPSLSFNGLQRTLSTNNYSFVDVQLDFDNPIQRDVKADYDGQAIANSLVNLFNTIPGQNLLNPTYGLNLMNYVFEPATAATGRAIGNHIIQNVNNFEPRVLIQNVDVKVNIDEQTFTIVLSILIPALNQQIQIPGILSRTGYSLLT
jgi:phage baseplate assembly protein W